MVENGARFANPNTDGAELVEDIRPSSYIQLDANQLFSGEFQSVGQNEWVMYKSRCGAFYKTDLEQFLQNQGIDTLVFTSCNFPNCPRTTMYEASERDFRVVMDSDSMSQVYDKGIQEIENIGVYVCEATDLIESISSLVKV